MPGEALKESPGSTAKRMRFRDQPQLWLSRVDYPSLSALKTSVTRQCAKTVLLWLRTQQTRKATGYKRQHISPGILATLHFYETQHDAIKRNGLWDTEPQLKLLLASWPQATYLASLGFFSPAVKYNASTGKNWKKWLTPGSILGPLVHYAWL